MIYICIPAYNEAGTAGVLLWKIREVMSEFARDYAILLLDDASTDATAEAVAPYARVLPLTVVRHRERLGYGASLEELLRLALSKCTHPKRDVAVTMQADFSEDPALLPALVKTIEGGADLVIAAMPGGEGVPRTLAWLRRARRWLGRRLKIPAHISDPFSGYRAVRLVTVKRAYESAGGGPLVRHRGWVANLEWLARVAPLCRRIEEQSGALRRDRLQRPGRFRPWAVFGDLVRLLARPPRPSRAVLPGPPSGMRVRPAVRAGDDGRRTERMKGSGRGRVRR